MSRDHFLPRLAQVHEDLPAWVDHFLETRGLAWRALETGGLWSSPALPFENLDQLIQFLILEDPVAFAECLFHERKTRGHPPWRFFPYQRVSLRTPGHTVHQCGAEVGKTREIAALAVWALVTGRGQGLPGEVLIAGALEGHLDPLHREILWQLQHSPWLSRHVAWDACRVKPYRTLELRNGNLCHFRPVGYDGAALRSLHVNLLLLGDEWAKVALPEAHGNFDSRAEPECWIRVYSTPDGNRSSPFFQLCESTPRVDPQTGPPPGRDWREPVRFVWPKTLMPAPFWSPERERFYLGRYGGRESQLYRQNVFGEHGDPAGSVFPWPLVEPCLAYLPEFLGLHLTLDSATRTLHLEAQRLCRGYRLGARPGDEDHGARDPEPPTATILSRAYELGNFDPAAALAAVLPRFEGRLVAGADLGSVNDPTEIWFGRCQGQTTRFLCRLTLSACDYPLQAKIVRALDQVLRPELGWGVDATGAGLALAQLLTDPDSGPPLDLSGYVLNRKVTDEDPATGAPRLDGAGQPIRVSLLELGTLLLEHAIHDRKTELPYDPALMLEFQGLIARATREGRAFEGRDHVITALRCALLRRRDQLQGTSRPPVAVHVPQSSARRLAARLEGFSEGPRRSRLKGTSAAVARRSR